MIPPKEVFNFFRRYHVSQKTKTMAGDFTTQRNPISRRF
jgi:hypothetical protein